MGNTAVIKSSDAGRMTSKNSGLASAPVLPTSSSRLNRDRQILDAAILIFSEKGYAAASLQDVAEAVGLLKGSLYHYISSKESLLFRIFQEMHAEGRQLMTQVDAMDLPPEEQLREFLERLTLINLEHHERATLCFSEWRHLTGEASVTVRRQRREFEAYLRRIITNATAAGHTRDGIDHKIATSYIWSALNGVLVGYRPRPGLSPKRLAAEVADLSCAAVLTVRRPANQASRVRSA